MSFRYHAIGNVTLNNIADLVEPPCGWSYYLRPERKEVSDWFESLIPDLHDLDGDDLSVIYKIEDYLWRRSRNSILNWEEDFAGVIYMKCVYCKNIDIHPLRTDGMIHRFLEKFQLTNTRYFDLFTKIKKQSYFSMYNRCYECALKKAISLSVLCARPYAHLDVIVANEF